MMEPEYRTAAAMLPEYMREGIIEWIEVARPTGGFLRALLTNDLRESFARADDANTAAMHTWIKYLYNYAPSECWGSPERVKEWIKRGGLLERVTRSVELEMDA